MDWIKIKDSYDLPRDGTVFLAIWKGRTCLTQFDKEEGRFYIVFDPAYYSQCWQIPPEREGKFSYWMQLPDSPA